MAREEVIKGRGNHKEVIKGCGNHKEVIKGCGTHSATCSCRGVLEEGLVPDVTAGCTGGDCCSDSISAMLLFSMARSISSSRSVVEGKSTTHLVTAGHR